MPWLKPFAAPAAATVLCFGIVLSFEELATVLPLSSVGDWTSPAARVQPHSVHRFFPFDTLWYARVAPDGYVWNPADPVLKQDVACFPLWPLILRLVSRFIASASVARWAVVGIAACFAAASWVAGYHVV